ncbi:MAG: hypothetical protein A2Z32_04860 [Chloroflexi bacterium RBG_16_69_14]|nr:MAG: hypothetical protein A2Z32_04860 [Chloroflexi bacterium RBG_16_69_14]
MQAISKTELGVAVRPAPPFASNAVVHALTVWHARIAGNKSLKLSEFSASAAKAFTASPHGSTRAFGDVGDVDSEVRDVGPIQAMTTNAAPITASCLVVALSRDAVSHGTGTFLIAAM